MGFKGNFIKEIQFTPEEVPVLEKKLFFEGPGRGRAIERFSVLLFLSTVIATYGVLGDSSAVVVGAMIIAPLMTPIMATAAGLVMGQGAQAIPVVIVRGLSYPIDEQAHAADLNRPPELDLYR